MRRREVTLEQMIELIGIPTIEATRILLASASSLSSHIFKEGSPFAKMLVKFGLVMPLSPIDAAVLLLSWQYTERDGKFMRQFIGGIPPIRQIREAKWSFLQSMPQLFCPELNIWALG